MFLNTKQPRRRHLVLKRAQKVAHYNRRLLSRDFAAEEEAQATAPEDVVVDAGEEIIFSYYRPSLRAGVYEIAVSHDVVIPNGAKKTLKSGKKFHVVGPRFSLEEGDVVGKYPPQGHGDHSTILPHVILGDPHLPWARLGTTKNVTDDRNSVPWLALLVFTQAELEVGAEILGEKGEQDPTGAVDGLTFGDIFNLQSKGTIACPFSEFDEETIDKASTARFIFVPNDIFRPLFSEYDPDGLPKDGEKPDTSRYKFLAHVRKINTEGLPEHVAGEDEAKLFSLVLAHRTAPLDLKETTSIAIHLVSIENVENLVKYPLKAGHVGMASLHSWTYSCFAAGTITLQERLRNLGETLNVLRPADSVINALGDGDIPAATAERLKQRARDGFTLLRYRVQTGDETIAFTRSPFVPGNVQYPIPNLVGQSLSSGTDLQVLDQHLGIMDITYSAAWQLGKTLAIADRAFTSALVRIRTVMAKESLRRAKIEVVRQNSGYMTIEDTLKGLADAVKRMSALPAAAAAAAAARRAAAAPTADGEAQATTPSRRWSRAKKELLDLSVNNPAIRSHLPRHCKDVMNTLAASTDGPGTFYAEYNEPVSPDWMLVFKWVLDRLFMYNIPPHYLLPDPEVLPNESLRFFAIDRSWTDALIDGALSVANHQTPMLDQSTRNAIKQRITDYLSTEDTNLHYTPQVPTYGMLLRSDVVAQFPGLAVRAPNNAGDNRAPILRQDVIADGTMLCLFDRAPGSDGFRTLTLQMPPHEQRFSVGGKITDSELAIPFKRVYTRDAPTVSYPPLETKTWKLGDKPTVFDWDSRTLNVEAYTSTAFDLLKKVMPQSFADDAKTAALAGIQLNDPMYEMSIGLGPSAMRRGGPGYDPIALAFGPQSRMLSLGPIADSAVSTSAISTQDNNARYSYGIWPIFAVPDFSQQDGSNEKPFLIPNNLSYPIDIVFSIVRVPSAEPRALTRIEVDITMTADAGMFTSYDGPGGYMLSNMRWTYTTFQNHSNERLLVHLLPRNDTDNTSPVEHNKEISFVLRGCKILPDKGNFWYVTFVEHYEDATPGGSVTYRLAPWGGA
jgi:hypothetical protein